ncbi:Gfo/Idh/MocA family oxidoreductase [Kribbella antibiotica]|uniref:Gfo/Idh/MocA family oxidoreductase n=1 Tax=Kribbella antibiotica TaxID=190195 RepID=A0A4R4YLK0_9ACTN|nr:Gfo/Idh/MocA family oxidoreductase [Kribbella antibiotica]TDD45310.1 Gfo/Idh/MocA family oxidoreductase [Kribbella antibiotica]
MSADGMKVPTVALVGTAGYGRRHLEQLLAWQADGVLRLAALVDVNFDAETRRLVDIAAAVEPQYLSSIDGLEVDLVVIATPPHTHFALAERVLRSGSALYLEKPPVPLLSQLDALRAITPRRRAEVGFQQARATIERLEALLPEVGDVERITAHGCLSRPDSYYTRSPWAGAWYVNGTAVFDGALFNPLAHIVHTALTLARRIDARWAAESVEADLYSVHDITGDDTGVLRIRSSYGPVVVAVGTTAADVVRPPAITVHGTRGHVTVPHVASTSIHPLLAALNDIDGPADRLIDLDAVRTFVDVVNQAVEVGEPVRIPVSEQQRIRAGVRCLPGIAELVDQVVSTGSLFAELGSGWARRPAPGMDREAM